LPVGKKETNFIVIVFCLLKVRLKEEELEYREEVKEFVVKN
jgi:hypothetical protein